MRHTRVVIILVVWFVAAIVAGAAELLARTPIPPPLIILTLATLTVAVALGSSRARAHVAAIDLRSLIALHLVRFVGVVFLVLVHRNVLSRAFVPIGWGDAAAALGAVLLLAFRADPSTPFGWRSVLVWNVLGFSDMVMLLATGIRLGRTDPSQFALFLELPFALLPMFFVPLIIATHVLIFVRLFASRTSSAKSLRSGSIAG